MNNVDLQFTRTQAGMKRSHLTFLTVSLAVGLICHQLSMSGSAPPAPDFVYPRSNDAPRLRLTELLTADGAVSFRRSRGAREKGLVRPTKVAFGAGADRFVLDAGRGVIIKLIDEGGNLSAAAEFGGTRGRFPSATGLAIAPSGDVWIVDSWLRSVFVISPDGKPRDSIVEIFSRPVDIAFHPQRGEMLVSDLAKNTIFAVNLSGDLKAEFKAPDSQYMQGPSFLTVGSDGRVYVCDALSGRVSVYSQTFQPVSQLGGFGDGPGYFARPKGVAVDSAGLIYVADGLFDNVQIFSAEGSLLLTLGHSGSGPGEFSQPSGLALDRSGGIHVADSYNRRFQVFRWENR
ncbi:MAG: 6-bladed beta-propeller [Candidatus Zixiibacteriota bacterium]